MKRFLFSIYLAIIAMVMCAADFTQDGIMYSTSINNTAWVISAKSVAGSVTLPADVTYNGQKYAVTMIASEAFSENENIEALVR